MDFLRNVSLLLIVLGVGWLTVSTGAFSDINADRTSDVGVANDQSALVGLDIERPVKASGGSTLTTVTNNAEETMEVSISLTEDTDPGVSIPGGQQTETIAPGASTDFTVNVVPAQQPEAIEFKLVATGNRGDGISVSLTRSTTVEEIDIGPCAGSRHSFGDVNGGIDVENGTVEIASGAQINGGVEAPGCVILGDGARVNGGVDAGKVVRLGADARVNGGIEAGEDVTLGSDALVQGGVSSGGSVTLEENARINGGVEAAGSLSLGSQAQITGDADVGGDVSLGDGAQITGGVDSDSENESDDSDTDAEDGESDEDGGETGEDGETTTEDGESSGSDDSGEGTGNGQNSENENGSN